MKDCETCGNPFEGHEVFKHPYNDGSLPPSATFGKRRADGSRGPSPLSQDGSGTGPEVSVVRAPFDPVLRLALINRGVITPDDLANAERQIAVLTGEVMSHGLRQGGQEGIRLQEPPEGVSQATHEWGLQGEGGTYRQRGQDSRSPVPNGEEGRTDPEEAPQAVDCPVSWQHGNPFRYCTCGWMEES